VTPPITCVTSFKGGVGKTRTTIEIAAAAVRQGRRVLLVDNDPRGSATARTGAKTPERTLNDVYEWAVNETGVIADAITPTAWNGVDIVASERALKNRENDVLDEGDFRLQRAFEGAALTYDLVLIDNAPAGAALMRNALVVASHALIVTDPEPDGLLAADDAIDSVKRIRRRMNPQLDLLGIIVNRYKAAWREHASGIEELLEAHGDLVWRPFIAERAAVATAAGATRPVQEISGAGARSYTMTLDDLTNLLLARTQKAA
jgi:chromosome partitioning protein